MGIGFIVFRSSSLKQAEPLPSSFNSDNSHSTKHSRALQNPTMKFHAILVLVSLATALVPEGID